MSETTTFNTFWHGRALSPVEQACLRSFVSMGHQIQLFAYDNITVPDGVALADAREIMPADRLFTFCDSLAAFSDVFRFKLLFEKGGWWIDTDVLNLKANIPECDYYWACESPGRINGAVLKFPPGDPACGELLRISEQRSRNLTRWGEIGPDLLTEVLAGFAPPRLEGSNGNAYPLHWLEAHFVWLPEFLDEVEQRVRNSPFVHLWNYMFKLMGINIYAKPPSNSFLSTQYRVLNIETEQLQSEALCRKSIYSYLSGLGPDRCAHFGKKLEQLLPHP